jgi:hypothetical protein
MGPAAYWGVVSGVGGLLDRVTWDVLEWLGAAVSPRDPALWSFERDGRLDWLISFSGFHTQLHHQRFVFVCFGLDLSRAWEG